MTCFCRGDGICDRNHHICEDCTCNHDGPPQTPSEWVTPPTTHEKTSTQKQEANPMSWEPQDDATYAQWIVYGETGEVIGTFGQDEYRAKECARVCGGRDRGIAAIYKETGR